MDKKKKMICRVLIALSVLVSASLVQAANDYKIHFCDRSYNYGVGRDSITLYFNLLDGYGRKFNADSITPDWLKKNLSIKEDNQIIPQNNAFYSCFKSGKRIPKEYTFSILVDLTIPEAGKKEIYDAIKQLVEATADSCVYLSFFGDEVTSSVAVNEKNLESFKEKFSEKPKHKYFYSGVYTKLLEFAGLTAENEVIVETAKDYAVNQNLSVKAKKNSDKNILIIFTSGKLKPAHEEDLDFLHISEYQGTTKNIIPKVTALYYTGQGEELEITSTLKGICEPKDQNWLIIESRKGKYSSCKDMNSVIEEFYGTMKDVMYDYSFTYKVDPRKTYNGKTNYGATFKGEDIDGSAVYSVGSVERPWPERVQEKEDVIRKYGYAVLIAIGAILFFYFISKIFVPAIRSKSFAMKFYKKYVPEENITRKICYYCKQDIQPGQKIVAKCKHVMHLSCWKQNGYRCAEYGQNCKIGIQNHIEWKRLFSLRSLKDCLQTISGIFVGLICWVLYDFIGCEYFNIVSKWIVDFFYVQNAEVTTLSTDCLNKTSAFLSFGMLLGFFVSLVFRYNDEYKKKNFRIILKIFALSLLTSIIGIIAFAVGSIILCLIVSSIQTTFVPWYASLPAYILFSVSISLALTIKSTIPVRSALLGGLCSAIIGFGVLYYSSTLKMTNSWLNLLLNFIIYGGGLGASLVTVRMLAEKYFLEIQNGVRAGQKIPIHKWMNAIGGGNKVSIGMTGDCEIQMNWEKSNKVAKEHVQLYIDYDRQLPMLKPLAAGVVLNARVELPAGKPAVLSNGDSFKIGDTTFMYHETE